MELPALFCARMKALLGEEYEQFLDSYSRPRMNGLRINSMKLSNKEFEAIAPFPVRRIPWTEYGYFVDPKYRPAAHPFYDAGLYYLQEPSAMTPADRLPINEGDRVLDLCAAPGGKSTQLAAKLDGSGYLVANEINTSRARALLRNLELFGTRNFSVLNENADRLAHAFPAFFDKILVDAPCSGEGMFRKHAEAINTWSVEKSEECAQIQRNLLERAYEMLRPGGWMLYSTCTFSAEENELSVISVLANHPDLQLIQMEGYEGFSSGIKHAADDEACAAFGIEKNKIDELRTQLEKCVRIFPHRMEGEGHFLALFRKNAGTDANVLTQKAAKIDANVFLQKASGEDARKGHKKQKHKRKNAGTGKQTGKNKAEESLQAYFMQFLKEIGLRMPEGRTEIRGEKLFLMGTEDLQPGLKFLRDGLFLGTFKTKRFEPSEPFALSISPKESIRSVELDGGGNHAEMESACGAGASADFERISAYLRGESIQMELEENGWYLVTSGGFPIGWAKYANGILKNKYPPAWRRR